MKLTKYNGNQKSLKFATTHTGCMVCLSHSPQQKGYIQIRINRRLHYLHRVIYELHNGSIPDEMSVLHKCDNPACSNPDHLFLGSNQDNVNDKVLKGRQPSGEDIRSAKLSEQQVLEILERLKTETQCSLATEFKVHKSTIREIKHRRSWKHVEPKQSNRTSHLPVPDDGDSINHQPHTTGREPYCGPVQLTIDFL